MFSTIAGTCHHYSRLTQSGAPPPLPSFPFIPLFPSLPCFSVFFSLTQPLLNSALTSALPKTTTKESRSLAVSGGAGPWCQLSQGVRLLPWRAGRHPKLCACCFVSGAGFPPLPRILWEAHIPCVCTLAHQQGEVGSLALRATF